MSTLKSKENQSYVMQINDLRPLVNNAGDTPQSVTPQQLINVISLNNFNVDTIYSSVKNTSITWDGQVEKMASDADVARIEDQTTEMFIGFTDNPLIEPVKWVDVGLTNPKDIVSTGAYVAWYSVGSGVFTLIQSKKYI